MQSPQQSPCSRPHLAFSKLSGIQLRSASKQSAVSDPILSARRYQHYQFDDICSPVSTWQYLLGSAYSGNIRSTMAVSAPEYLVANINWRVSVRKCEALRGLQSESSTGLAIGCDRRSTWTLSKWERKSASHLDCTVCSIEHWTQEYIGIQWYTG